MIQENIKCPKCGTFIKLTEAITQDIEKAIKEKSEKEMELRFSKERAQFETKIKKEAQESVTVELADLKEQLAEKDKKIAESQKQDLELRKKERLLQGKEEALAKDYDQREKELKEKFASEKAVIEQKAKKEIEEKQCLEMTDLKSQLEEKTKRLEEATQQELNLRKKQRGLEEKEKSFELEKSRAIDAEREKIRENVTRELDQSHKLKDAEKEKQLADMRKQIEDLKRKAEQGSQQTQGEVLELELENILRANFPVDQIEPVPKGIRGADILQKVHNQSGQYCGTIIWESKRTKGWKDGWITKLKDDQREVKAEIAVLMSATLPQDISNFSSVNDVWVTDYASVVGLAAALRFSLIQIAMTKLATVGKQEKMEVLYNYLSGSEFRQKVEAIVEAFSSLKNDLSQEKRAMEKIWAKREKQIERVITNTARMYGDMQGIIGASLPELKSLELKALPAGTDSNGSNKEDENDIPF